MAGFAVTTEDRNDKLACKAIEKHGTRLILPIGPWITYNELFSSSPAFANRLAKDSFADILARFCMRSAGGDCSAYSRDAARGTAAHGWGVTLKRSARSRSQRKLSSTPSKHFKPTKRLGPRVRISATARPQLAPYAASFLTEPFR